MFNNKLDKSLGLILESDEENRKEIIEFLKRIPEELFQGVRDKLQNVSNKDADHCLFFEGSVISDDGTVYSYEINFDEQEISLAIRQDLVKPINDQGAYINFGMELLLVDEGLSFPIDLNDEFWAGDFTYTCAINTKKKLSSSLIDEKFMPFFYMIGDSIELGGYMQEQETEYDVLNTKSGYSIRKSRLGGKIDYISIDVTQVPDEITMDYIDQRYGENPLVRRITPPKK